MRPKITQIGPLWIFCGAPLCSGMAFCRTGKGSPRSAKGSQGNAPCRGSAGRSFLKQHLARIRRALVGQHRLTSIKGTLQGYVSVGGGSMG